MIQLFFSLSLSLAPSLCLSRRINFVLIRVCCAPYEPVRQTHSIRIELKMQKAPVLHRCFRDNASAGNRTAIGSNRHSALIYSSNSESLYRSKTHCALSKNVCLRFLNTRENFSRNRLPYRSYSLQGGIYTSFI